MAAGDEWNWCPTPEPFANTYSEEEDFEMGSDTLTQEHFSKLSWSRVLNAPVFEGLLGPIKP